MADASQWPTSPQTDDLKRVAGSWLVDDDDTPRIDYFADGDESEGHREGRQSPIPT